MDSTLTLHRPMQDPRRDSCLAPCSPHSHLHSHIIEAILPRLVPTVPHLPGSPTSPRLRPPHSPRTGRHIYLPGPLDRCLLGLGEVLHGETTDKPLVHPPAVEG